MSQASATYYKRDFWADENLKYQQPHFRLEKAARLANRIAGEQECDLLDVGCGPAALRRLLKPNINYYGIDIAIHEPSPSLVEMDFVESPIAFNGKRFDIIVAQGVFEYIGKVQQQKLSEIGALLNENGTFIATYINFDHRNKSIYWPYNNMQPFTVFYRSLSQFFHVDKFFPTSQRWRHDEPKGRLMKAAQMHMNLNIPFITRMLAVEYFFVCSPRFRACSSGSRVAD